jgi:hypothetical protein
LSAETTDDGTHLVLTCSGSAESEASGALFTTLAGLHERAVGDARRAVIADIRELEFASSSCIKAFVAWLQQIQQLDDAQRYKVRFRSNPRYAWQQRSLNALAAFAAGVVEIEPS